MVGLRRWCRGGCDGGGADGVAVVARQAIRKSEDRIQYYMGSQRAQGGQRQETLATRSQNDTRYQES